MRKCLRPEELVSHMGQMDTQTQHEELEKSYQVVVEDYRRIIERLASQAWSVWEILPARSPPSQHTGVLPCLYKAHIITDFSCNQDETLLIWQNHCFNSRVLQMYSNWCSSDRLQRKMPVYFPADVDTVEENSAAGGWDFLFVSTRLITLCEIKWHVIFHRW